MPARLEEAFVTSLDHVNKYTNINQNQNQNQNIKQIGGAMNNMAPIVDDNDELISLLTSSSSLESLKNPEYINNQNITDVTQIQSSCDNILAHVWSCANCRNQLRNLDGLSDNTNSFSLPNLKQLFSQIDLQTVLYYLLIFLAVIIIIDYFVRLGRKISRLLV